MSDASPDTAGADFGGPGYVPPSYEHVVQTYGLDILKGGADFSVENGDLALTKDGDIKLGDTVHSALFRLVQAWRLNAPHLRFLFGMVTTMQTRRRSLDNKMSEIGEKQRARFDIRTFPASDEEFITSFHGVIDEQNAAEYGFSTYAGCVVLLLSGALLRFKNDIDATADDWTKAAPLFGGHSLGQIIVASANGFRHDDEWAKTRPSTPQQKASQEILTKALPSTTVPHERAPGRCPEVLDMLSQGGNFEKLNTNLFTFAHHIALRRRAATQP
jgi:hypothetical protein